MDSKPLSIIDQAFLLFETEASPKHVGGVFILKRPAGSTRAYARKLYNEMLGHDKAIAPFNLRLSLSPLSGYCWREVEALDIRDHVFYHKMPPRATREDLLDFVGELHTPCLDRTRPMWETHVIDGVAGGTFGIYIKIHHAYGDGMSYTKLFSDFIPRDPSETLDTVFWNLGKPFNYGSTGGKDSLDLWRILKMVGKPARAIFGLNKISLLLGLERFGLTKSAIALPFTSERSPLTGQVTAGRQVAGAAVSMERVSNLRKRTRSTLNHIALTCVDGALRRYLDELGSDFDKPLSIQMPVSLRTEEDGVGGNKIGIVLVELSPKTDDPYVRLREIGVTLRNVRHQVDTLPASSIVSYGVIVFTVSQIAEILGLSDVVPPLGNTLVSNVPGPKDTRFVRDAELAEYYPLSALPPGLHLNITLFSYAGRLNFGLVATRDMLPDLHRLGDYIEEAFSELEAAIEAGPPESRETLPKPRPKRVKAKAKPKAKAKAKAKTKARTKPKAKAKEKPKAWT